MADVSVVMGVFNGAAELGKSIESILVQNGVDFEFIIVNDGSTDETADVLAVYAASDKRIRIINQHNQGLTRALIRGCSEASGRYIARQDVGDVSLPGKLKKLHAAAAANPDAALLSCGTRFLGPRGETLYVVIQNQGEATTRLRSMNSHEIRGPSSHPSVLFPRHLYEQVGGYRKEFYFAQDLDLWARLVERGDHMVIREVLYETTYTPGSISGVNKSKQDELAKCALACAGLRRNNKSEQPVLLQASKIRPSGTRPTRLQKAAALYFIGACLKKNRHANASGYLVQSLLIYPFYLKSLVKLIQL